MDYDDDFDIIIENDDDYEYDDGIYDNDTFLISDFEEKEVDKLTKNMNEYFDPLNDFIKELGENIDLKEYFKERNECINELKKNFGTLCENNQYIIDNSFLLTELKKIICKTIENKEIELLNQKNNIGVERYEMQLKKYEMKLQLYELQKINNPTTTKIINKLKKDVEEYEKKIFK